MMFENDGDGEEGDGGDDLARKTGQVMCPVFLLVLRLLRTVTSLLFLPLLEASFMATW